MKSLKERQADRQRRKSENRGMVEESNQAIAEVTTRKTGKVDKSDNKKAEEKIATKSEEPKKQTTPPPNPFDKTDDKGKPTDPTA